MQIFIELQTAQHAYKMHEMVPKSLTRRKRKKLQSAWFLQLLRPISILEFLVSSIIFYVYLIIDKYSHHQIQTELEVKIKSFIYRISKLVVLLILLSGLKNQKQQRNKRFFEIYAKNLIKFKRCFEVCTKYLIQLPNLIIDHQPIQDFLKSFVPRWREVYSFLGI